MKSVQNFFAILAFVWAVAKVAVPLVLRLKFGHNKREYKPIAKESNMFALTEQENAVLAALQETEDWILVLEKVENIVAENLKTKDVWYVELANIGGDILTQCAGDIAKAIEGCTNIPAEWKVSTTQDKINFVLKVLVNQGKFIAGLFLPKSA
jgi:hypothetical protein